MNFAFYASYLAVAAYMARMIDFTSSIQVLALFYLGILWGIILLVVSIIFTYRALTGFDYRVLSSADEILDYQKKLDEYANEIKLYNETYNCTEPIPCNDTKLEQFTVKMLAKCSTFNAKINEARKIGIRKSLWYLMLASLPLVFSSVLFVGFDLDSSSPRKVFQIEDKSLTSKLEELSKATLNEKTILTLNTSKEKL